MESTSRKETFADTRYALTIDIKVGVRFRTHEFGDEHLIKDYRILDLGYEHPWIDDPVLLEQVRTVDYLVGFNKVTKRGMLISTVDRSWFYERVIMPKGGLVLIEYEKASRAKKKKYKPKKGKAKQSKKR